MIFNKLIKNELKIFSSDEKCSYLNLRYCDFNLAPSPNESSLALPPLQIIGSYKNIKNKIIVVSLEPKYEKKLFKNHQDYVFKNNVPSASKDRGNVNMRRYNSWQLGHFTSQTRSKTQLPFKGYWKKLAYLAQGYSNNSFEEFNNEEDGWNTLDESLIELPLFPMHSVQFSAKMNNYVLCLLMKRLRSIIEDNTDIQRLKILLLGKMCCNVLQNSDIAFSGVNKTLPKNKPSMKSQYGNRFYEEISVKTHTITIDKKNVECVFFFRTSPFSNGWSPTSRGIYQIGKEINQF